MDTGTEDPRGYHSRASSDPHIFRDHSLFQSDEEMGFPSQMGSGRRDARVVCETFSSSTSGRNFGIGGTPKMRQSESQKGAKPSVRRRRLAYSRNPLLACFAGESVLSSRAIRLSPTGDGGSGSQRAFFSLIPVDRSRVNERTGEPQSPQLSCIGQVKHRQVKIAKAVEIVTEDLTRMDINDGVIPHSVCLSRTGSEVKTRRETPFKLQTHNSFQLRKDEPSAFKVRKEDSFFKLRKGESFKLRKEESFKLQKEESFKLQKEESFKLQRKLRQHLNISVDDEIPHLDLSGGNVSGDEKPSSDPCVGGKNSARLMRCRRAGDDEKKAEDDIERVNSSSPRNSIRHLNHFLKQKLGASMVKSGFVCGWSSGEESPRSERSEPDSEHYEIDLSRFASGDMQAKTPSFRDSRYYQHATGKKLAEIRMHCLQQMEYADVESWKNEMQGKEENDASIHPVSEEEETLDFPTAVVVKCSPSKVILQPATEATLWKRRCIDRPLSLEVRR